MSGTNHRTWQTYHVGHLLTTVELDPVADAHNVEQYKALSKVAYVGGERPGALGRDFADSEVGRPA
jgi:hypothetical protein